MSRTGAPGMGQLGLYILHNEPLELLHDDGCECNRILATEAGYEIRLYMMMMVVTVCCMSEL